MSSCVLLLILLPSFNNGWITIPSLFTVVCYLPAEAHKPCNTQDQKKLSNQLVLPHKNVVFKYIGNI